MRIEPDHRAVECGHFCRQTSEIVVASAKPAAGIVQIGVRNNDSGQSENDAHAARNRVADFISRSRRAEDGRGHKAGASFRCGDLNRPRRQTHVRE